MGLEDVGAAVQEWLSLPPIAVVLSGWRLCGYAMTVDEGLVGLQRHDLWAVFVALLWFVPWTRVAREATVGCLALWPASEGVLRAAGMIPAGSALDGQAV